MKHPTTARLLLPLITLAQLATASGTATDQHQLGTRYSPLQQINRENVAHLELA